MQKCFSCKKTLISANGGAAILIGAHGTVFVGDSSGKFLTFPAIKLSEDGFAFCAECALEGKIQLIPAEKARQLIASVYQSDEIATRPVN